MNKTNPIFEAMNELNENYAAEAVSAPRKRAKKPLKLAVIAAAAAALTVVVGFTTAATVNHSFGFSRENSAERRFELKLTAHDIIIPEEFKPRTNGLNSFDNVDIPPRELFGKFGLDYPFNDNFTAADDKPSSVDVGILDDTAEVFLDFTMYNKTINRNVCFNARYFSKTDKLTYISHQELLPCEPAEVITLKDGSLCMVSASMAVFSLDGAKYTLSLPYDYDVPANIGDMPEEEQYKIAAEMAAAMPGIDTVKQVLADLMIFESV